MDGLRQPQVHTYAFQASVRSDHSRASLISAAQLTTLITTLRQHLPTSIGLVRQLELYPTTPTSVILSTFPLPSSSSPSSFPPYFAFGFFDRSGSPAVECWVYTHLDVAAPPLPQNAEDVVTAEEAGHAKAAAALLLSLFTHLAASPYGTGLDSALTGETVTTASHMLVGAVPGSLRAAMVASPALAHMMRDDLYTAGGPYSKFIFAISGMAQRLQDTALPEGMTWSEVTEADYPLVLASNDIMKIPAMVRGLPSAALRLPGGTMVAWGFLGPHACVRALYCAEEWRGQGLARLVVMRLHTVAGGLLEGVKDGLGHADASDTNTGSVKLFESLGGKKERSYYWIKVDLDRLPRI